MLTLLKALLVPISSLILMMLASGLFNTFVSIRLEIEGYSTEDIGIVTSALYLGILVGSLRIDRWIARAGHIRSFAIFAIVLTLLVLAQAMWINIWYWSALRFIGGICTAGVFIVIESWFLIQGGPQMRGTSISLYLAILYAALSGGQLLLDLSDPKSFWSFYITAALLGASIAPLLLYKIAQPKISPSERLGLLQLLRLSPLGFAGGVISGMLLASIYGLLPVYGKEVGMRISEIGTLMAILIFGGFSLQWPLGHLADRTGKRKILNIASLITTLLAFTIATMHPLSNISFMTLAWFFGGFSFTLYPLSMAHACERMKENQIVPATGGFVLSYGVGAIAGPLLAPLSMQYFGSAGLFYFLGAITLMLCLFGIKRPATYASADSDATRDDS